MSVCMSVCQYVCLSLLRASTQVVEGEVGVAQHSALLGSVLKALTGVRVCPCPIPIGPTIVRV